MQTDLHSAAYPPRRRQRGPGQILLLLLALAMAAFSLAPVLAMLTAAFTDDNWILDHGFSIFPSGHWSLNGVRALIRYSPQLWTSLAVSLGVTAAAVCLGLLIMSMYAYASARRGFRLAGFLGVFALLPLVLSGGQLSEYLVFTRWYGLGDSPLLLILLASVSAANVLVLRTWILRFVPAELTDAAEMDGAGESRTFFRVVLPLMKPALAAVGFLLAAACWNDWQTPMLYITSPSRMPLTAVLVRIQSSIDFLLNSGSVPPADLEGIGGFIPPFSTTMFAALISAAPVLILYPFFHRSLVRAVPFGALK